MHVNGPHWKWTICDGPHQPDQPQTYDLPPLPLWHGFKLQPNWRYCHVIYYRPRTFDTVHSICWLWWRWICHMCWYVQVNISSGKRLIHVLNEFIYDISNICVNMSHLFCLKHVKKSLGRYKAQCAVTIDTERFHLYMQCFGEGAYKIHIFDVAVYNKTKEINMAIKTADLYWNLFHRCHICCYVPTIAISFIRLNWCIGSSSFVALYENALWWI